MVKKYYGKYNNMSSFDKAKIKLDNVKEEASKHPIKYTFYFGIFICYILSILFLLGFPPFRGVEVSSKSPDDPGWISPVTGLRKTGGEVVAERINVDTTDLSTWQIVLGSISTVVVGLHLTYLVCKDGYCG